MHVGTQGFHNWKSLKDSLLGVGCLSFKYKNIMCEMIFTLKI